MQRIAANLSLSSGSGKRGGIMNSDDVITVDSLSLPFSLSLPPSLSLFPFLPPSLSPLSHPPPHTL